MLTWKVIEVFKVLDREYLTTKNLWRKCSDKFENKNNSKCIKKAAKYKGMGKSFNDSGFQFLS